MHDVLVASVLADETVRGIVSALLILTFAIPLASADLRERRLPNRVVLLFSVVTLGWVLLLSVAHRDLLWLGVRWAVMVAIPAIAVAFFIPRAWGMGDAKLAPALAAMVAVSSSHPGSALLFVLWIASATGGFAAVVLRLRQGRWPASIPYGPHLLAAAMLGCVLPL